MLMCIIMLFYGRFYKKTPGLLLIFATLIIAFYPRPVSSAEDVKLYLQWYHQFQFAGYYAALEKGFFQEEGLKVDIIEGGPGVETFKDVASASGRYGTAHAAGLLIHRAKGQPLVMLACIFQHSPNVIISRKDRNISTPHDIVNSKTVIWPGGHVELSAMLLSEGIDPKPFCQQPQGSHLKDLIEGRIDAIDGYITNEVFTARQAGVPVSIISPVNYGIDFYGDTLITSEKELLDYPDRVRKFRAASLRGWKYAMAHPQELVEIILNKYTTGKSREHLLYEAEMTKELVTHELVELGHVNPRRCQRMIEVLDKQNKTKLDINLENLLYDPNPKGISSRSLFLIKIFIGAIAIISLVALGLYYFNRRLRNEITIRKKAEEIIAVQKDFLNSVFNSLTHPFYVIDANDYTIKMANKALGVGDLARNITCHELTHRSNSPCDDIENTCPLNEIKRTKKPAVVEHIHYNNNGNPRYMEVHGYPILDDKGNVTQMIESSIDITERKRMEELLQISEQRFRELAENINEVFWMENAEGTDLLYVSPAYERVWGRTCESFYENPKSWIDSIHPDDRDRVANSFSQWKVKGGYSEEFRIVRPDGEIRWIFDRGFPIKDESGNYYRIAGIAEDITERKNVEKMIRSNESFLQAIFDGIQDGISILDKDLNIVRVNRAMEKWSSHALPLSGKKCFQAYHGKSEACTVCPTIRTLEEGDIQMDVVPFTDPKGQRGWQELFAFPLKDEDGNVTGVIEYVRDVTERKQTEELLEKSEKRIRETLENVHMVAVSLDLNGNITFANNFLLELTGYSREEVMGKNWFDMFVPQEWRDKVSKTFNEIVVKEGYVHFCFENPIVTREGELRHVFWNNSVLRDTNNILIEVASLGEDVTVRKLAEEQIKASLKEKEVLLKEIHHRVKNNMQVVSSLLKLQARSVKDKGTIDILEESQNRIKAMSMIHEKLYRSENLANINFGEYIKNLANELFRSYKMSVARVALKMEVDDITIDIDSVVPCGLIVNELITNSLKYAFPDNIKGEIKISLRKIADCGLQNAELKTEISNPKSEMIELVFSDNGIGIPENIDYRNTDSMGLRLIFNLTEHQLGGKVELDRSKGTEFTIRFKEERYKERI